MMSSSMRRRAFTLVEIVVMLVVIGISLAVVAPSLILRGAEPGISEVLTASRRAAIRRGQSVTLAIGADGKWATFAARRVSEPLLSGVLPPLVTGSVEILVSPVGVCTVQRGRVSAGSAFDPLTCTVAERVESARVELAR